MNEGEPRLEETGRGFTVRYRGRYLYSPVDPCGGALRRVASARLRERSLVYVPGVGLGYGLEALLRALPEHSQLLCVETDPSLMALADMGPSPLPRDPRLTLLCTDSPEEAAAALRGMGLHRFRRLQTLALCGSYHLYRAGYDSIRQALEEEIRLFWQNRLTLAHLSRLWLRNLFTNLAACPEADPIPDLSGERPIVVAGAGPSLDRCLPQILRLRARLTLLAVDTALPVLAEAGCPPDWVFALEAQQANLEDFLPYRDPGLALLCDLTSAPSVTRLFPRRAYFCTRFSPLALFDRLRAAGLLPQELPPLGSVGVAAVQAALGLTRGPVLLAGLDFAYPGGRTHARGTPPHRRTLAACSRLRPPGLGEYEALLARPLLTLRSVSGRPVLSDLVLRSYAVQLGRVVEAAGRVYDLGGMGLPTGATPLGSPADVEALLGRPAAGRLPAAPAFRPARAAIRAFLRAEQERLRLAEEALACLIAAARRGEPAPAGGRLPEAVREVEYVQLPVPEADPERLAAPGNLVLAAMQARSLRGLLGRLLS
jgi:hypothetical protein